MNTQKAAMFGLDARIALAIFGALSVISGASLYSAIQEAKLQAYLTQIKEVSKAFDQYRLDTGGELDAGPGYNFTMEDLIEPTGDPFWKGPYINAEKSSSTSSIFINIFGERRSISATSRRARTADRLSNAPFCEKTYTDFSTCAIAFCMVGLNPSQYKDFLPLKKKLDGNKDWDEGYLQISQASNNTLIVDESGADISICYVDNRPLWAYGG